MVKPPHAECPLVTIWIHVVEVRWGYAVLRHSAAKHGFFAYCLPHLESGDRLNLPSPLAVLRGSPRVRSTALFVSSHAECPVVTICFRSIQGPCFATPSRSTAFFVCLRKSDARLSCISQLAVPWPPPTKARLFCFMQRPASCCLSESLLGWKGHKDQPRCSRSASGFLERLSGILG